MYRYLNVRGDAAYAADAPVTALVAALAARPELVATGPRAFANANDFPWLRVRVVRCDGAGNYADDDGPLERGNLIELICSDGDEAQRLRYDGLALAIAAALGWEAVDDADGAALAPDSITLVFGTPEHGWLDVRLLGPEGTSHLDASDVPCDSLAMLVGAATDLIEGRPPRDVIWCLEPVEITWSFRPRGDLIAIVARSDYPPHRDRVTPIGADRAEALALIIWRAMRRLEVDPAWRTPDLAPGSRVWSHSFPSQAVAALGACLRERGARGPRG